MTPALAFVIVADAISKRGTRPVSRLLFQEPSAGTGEVLLSISYLPAANRLLVVLIKAKNLHSNQAKELLGKGERGVRGDSQGASSLQGCAQGEAAPGRGGDQ